MSVKAIAAIIFASAAAPVAALAQDTGKTKDPGQKKRIRQAVNLRVEEWFDEEREDGVTYARHPYTLVAPNFTYQGACHWRRRERDRTSPFPVYSDDDQDEEQEDQDRERPELPALTTTTPILVRDTSGRVTFDIPASFRIPEPSGTSFDEIKTDMLFGGAVFTTLRLWEKVDLSIWLGYRTGKFDSEASSQRTIPDPLGHGVIVATETDRLTGTLGLFELGLSPVLARFDLVEDVLGLELSLVAGGYYGRLSGMEVESAGGLSGLPDEDLFGGFGGVAGTFFARLSDAISIGVRLEAVYLLGDLEGQVFRGGIEVSFRL